MAYSSNLLQPQSQLPMVINTRPVERAAPLTHQLQRAGFTVMDMPMLALQPLAVGATDIQLMNQWLDGEYQVLVVVSPTAAASGLAMWQKLVSESLSQQKEIRLKETKLKESFGHIVAVGDATAAVLQNDSRLQAGNYQVLQPVIANNEGMLAMPEIENLQAGDKLLVWRGLGGRRLLVDTLQARGVHIDSIAWYERIMPSAASTHYQQWLQQFNPQHTHLKPIVIISSGTAFEHWTCVVNQAQTSTTDTQSTTLALKLTDFTYIVLGVRLAKMVADQQLSYKRVEDLAPATILAAIQSDNG